MRKSVDTIKAAIVNFIYDDAFTLAGALAFYTMLSLAPLAVILVSVAAFLGQDAQKAIVDEITVLIGPTAGSSMANIIDNAQ